jgi:hypothetical protein
LPPFCILCPNYPSCPASGKLFYIGATLEFFKISGIILDVIDLLKINVNGTESCLDAIFINLFGMSREAL